MQVDVRSRVLCGAAGLAVQGGPGQSLQVKGSLDHGLGLGCQWPEGGV